MPWYLISLPVTQGDGRGTLQYLRPARMTIALACMQTSYAGATYQTCKYCNPWRNEE